MSGQTFSTFTEVGMIDARLKTGIITLPTTTSIPFRILTLKDVYGAASFSTVTISTQTGDAFEDGTTTRSINAAWGMTTLYAGKAGTWYTIGGSILTTASISSLTVSSIFGLTNFVSTPYLATQLGSTVIGLGTAGYLSSIPSLGGFVSTANLANLVSTANLANLVSTANLANLVSTANLVNLVSTANLAGLVSTSYLTTQIGSTVIGLGTAGYISTVNLANLVSTANLANFVSTANLANLISTANLANHVSTANLANLVSTANLANLVSTTYLATQLGSTVRGLGTAGYLSSINYSTVVLSSLTAQNLTSVQGYISSLTVDSLFLGSNSAFVDMGDVIATSLSTIQINVGTQFAVTISAQQLFVSSIQATNIIGALTTANLTSTVIGLGTAGYISTGLGGFSFVSTANLANLVSTANLAGHISTANLANLVSTTYLATQLGSTVIGLGTAGYISTIIFGPIVSTHNLANLVSTANLANLVSTANLANLVSTANLANLVSTANLASLVSTSYLQTQLGSTVIGLGTAGYISSSQLLSTSAGLSQYISSFIDPTELTSTVIGLGTQGFVSSLGLTFAVASTAQGLGTFGYTSTSQLLSTSLGLYQEIQNSPANIKQSNVTSTIIGLGTFGYLSTIVFGSVVSTANLVNLVSTANLANLISTANLANLISTANLANLVSTANLANLVSTANLANLVSTANLANLVSTTNLANLVSTANLANLVSTANLANLVSTSYLASQLGSTVRGLGTAGYLSSINYSTVTLSSLTAQNLTSVQGYISSLYVDTLFLGSNNAFIEMGDVVATSISTIQLNTGNLVGLTLSAQQLFVSSIQATNIIGALTTTNLTSTVIGLGTVGYISTGLGGFSFVSTANLANLVSTANLANHISTANLANLISTANLANLVSTANLANLVSTANLANLVSTANLANLVSTANLANLVSTANLVNLVSTANLANLVSTSYLQSQLGSTVIGLGTAGYLSSIVFGSIVSTANLANLVSTANLANFVSTANLANLVSTANLANFVSTANLANHISTANLANLVSTTYLATQLASTVIGLGTAGYISSAQLLSTTNGYSLNFTTQNASISSLRFSTATANNAYISSLNIDQLTFGDGNGWADFGVLRALAISTLVVNTGILYATTVSTSQIIGVNFLVQSNLTSTVIGLGTVGYLSSVTAVNLANLVSTANLANLVSTANLANLVSTANLANLVSTANLANLVSTANLANFVSTANLANLVSTANLANLVSTTYLATQIGSTVIGLGTAGYLSTIVFGSIISTANLANLVSTANLANLVSTANLANLVSTANLANLVSTANLANFVSTTYLATQLGSTVRGLGTAGYLSTINYSTVVLSSLTAQNLTSVQGYISSLTVDAFYLGSNSAFFNMGDVIATSLSTIQINVGTQFAVTLSTQQLFVSSIQATNIIGALTTANLVNMVSTANLANHISTANLANLVSTANLANLVSTANLANLVSTANLANLVSTANLANLVSTTYIATQLGSTVIGLGTAGYVSSSQLLSTSAGLSQYISSFIDPTELTSTVIGLGTQGFVSSLGLTFAVASTAQGLGTFGYTSTSQLLSTSLGLYQEIQNSPTNIKQSNVTSTIIGLGTFGYLSTVVFGSIISTANLANHVSTANLANLVSTANLANHISTANLANLVSTSYLATQIGSTVIGLGTTGYVSSSQLLSTSFGLNLFISTFYVDHPELLSTVAGLGTLGYLSTGFSTSISRNFLTSSLSTVNINTANVNSLTATISSLTVNALFIGTGTGFTDTGDTIGTSLSTITITANSITSISLSTQQLNVSSITGISIVSQTNLTSTVIGLGTTGYLSSALTTIGGFGLVSTANLANLVSTANLAGHISTANLAGHISTANLANLVSTANLANLVSTANLANLVSTANLANLVSTANLANHISTANLANFVSTTYLSTQLGSTFATLRVSSLSTFSLQGTTAFISSLTVNGLFIGSNQGFVNMGDVIATSVSSLVVYAGGMFSTSNSTQQTFLSSINGVAFANIGSGGIAGIPSSLNTSSISTFSFTGTTGFISSLTVNALFIGSNQGFVNMGDVIATSLSSLVIYTGSIFATSNQASITSTQQLNISSINGQTFGGPIISTVIGLGTAGYLSTIVFGSIVSTANLAHHISTANLANLISTANLANLVSTANLANLVSTANLANLISTANLANLVSTANLANHISTANLANLVSTANLANLVSTANLANLVSTANLANFVSTSFLATQLGSTVRGLGTAGYLSSINYSTVLLSSLTAMNLTSVQGYISSLVVDSLQLGSNTAYIYMGDVIATSLSTVYIATGSLNTPRVSTQQLFVSSIQATNIIGALTTANLVNLVSTANLANLVSTANLAGHISTANLAGHISTANLAGHISTANLANFVSTTYLSTQLGSTFTTLRVSSLSTFSLQGTTAFISSLTVNGLFAGTAVIGIPSVFGNVCAYFGNSSRAANGSEYALIQENNGRTFLNAVSGTDLRFRINNTDVMIMSNDGLYMSQQINMNGNNITAGSNQLLSIGTNTTATNAISFSNYGGGLGDIKMKSYNIDIGDNQNGTIAIRSGSGGYATIGAGNIWLQGTVNMCNNNINNIYQLNFSNSANIDGAYANQLNFNATNSYFLGNLRFFSTGRTLDIADNTIQGVSYIYGTSGGFLTINAVNAMVIENNQGARQALNTDGSFEFRTTGANKTVYINADAITFNGSSNNRITNVSTINGVAYPAPSGAGVWASTATTALNMAGFGINNVNGIVMNGGILTMDDNPLRLRNDQYHALAFGNSGTYNVGINGVFLVGYRGGALGSSDPTFNDKSFAWSSSNLVAYKPLDMNSNDINNVSTIKAPSGTPLTIQNDSGGAFIQLSNTGNIYMVANSGATNQGMNAGLIFNNGVNITNKVFGNTSAHTFEVYDGSSVLQKTVKINSNGLDMCNTAINNAGIINSSNINAGTAVIGTPSYYGNTFAFFGNNSLPSTGSDYALLQEFNGTTFLNCSSGRTIRFRYANYDIMTLDSVALNMLSNNITNVNTISALSTQQITITQTSGSDFVLFNNGDTRQNAKRDAYVGGDRDVYVTSVQNMNIRAPDTQFITIQQTGAGNQSYLQFVSGGNAVLNSRTYIELVSQQGSNGIYLTGSFTECRGYLTFNTSNNYINNVRNIYGDTGASGGGLAIDYMYGLFFNSSGKNANLYIDAGNLNMLNYNSGINIGNYNSNGTGNVSLYSASNDVILGTGSGRDINLNGGRFVSINAAQPGGSFGIYASTINATSLLDTNITSGQNMTLRADQPDKSITCIASTINMNGTVGVAMRLGGAAIEISGDRNIYFTGNGSSRYANFQDTNVAFNTGTPGSLLMNMNGNDIINVRTLTASNSSSPVTFSNATSAANHVVKCEMGGANFIIRQSANASAIAVIENTGGGAILINPLGASVSIGSSNNSYMLDVAGIARSGIPVSSLTGTSATFGANAFGIYYYITNSAFSNIGLYNTSGGATGTGGTAPPIGTGWYVTLRNNTGSYLSITVNGLLVSTPASPFTIPPANSVTIAYDANLAGGAGYVFF